ncbi:MAG: hypothetical protein WC006_07035 [Bacilli bacterium]|nr:hypothetical protein [Bacilli bacterium]
MYLGIIEAIRTFFRNLFSKFQFDNLIVLIFGIVFGFLLCFLIYFTFVIASLKKEEKKVEVNKENISMERIERLIKSAKNQYLVDSATKSTAEKINDVKEISWELINAIAKEYFPDSKYPIYELSIDELMMLNHYITNRVDSLFKGPVLKPFKKLRIAYILKILDMKKKIDENKAVKAATKLNKPWKIALSVLNVFNPAYWVKKLMISTTLVAVTNKIGSLVIEVVGDETNKVYSKSVFNEERSANIEVEKSIMELENLQVEE